MARWQEIQYQHKGSEIMEDYQLLILVAKRSFLLCKLIYNIQR